MENLTKRNAERTSIALVEDDDTIRELIEINLKSENYQVDSFFSIEQLEKNYKPGLYDLLILDIMLPGKSGLTFAEKLYSTSSTIPTLFISALNQEAKIREAYRLGAIDYIIKPFAIDLLLQKIRNLLLHFIPRTGEVNLPIEVGTGKINWDLMEITTSTKETVNLSPKESQALLYFLQNPNRIITRKELISYIWGEDVFVSGRNIDNFLVKFRKLFEADASDPKIFLTFLKKGYACRLNE